MIYVVYGSTGEYSDHTEWSVCYYWDKHRAENHAQLANSWLKENDVYGAASWHAREAALKKKNPYDPNMSIDYTGTLYDVHELKEGWI